MSGVGHTLHLSLEISHFWPTEEWAAWSFALTSVWGDFFGRQLAINKAAMFVTFP